jgi:hypothetical protein
MRSWSAAVLLSLLLASPARAQPAPLGEARDYVLIGESLIRLGTRTLVVGGSTAVTAPAGLLRAGKDVELPGGADVAGDQVRLFQGARVGRLFANAVRDAGAIILDGGPFAVTLPLSLVATLPPFPAVAADPANPITVPAGATVVLPPGAYGDVKVETLGTLVLRGLDAGGGAGTYHVTKLTVGFQGQMLADNPVVVNTAEKFTVLAHTFVGPAPLAPVAAGDLQLNVGATALIYNAATVVAHLRAPAATVRLAAGAVLTGRIVADRITTVRKVTLTRQGGCGDGLLEPVEECDASVAGGDGACPGQCAAAGTPGQCTCACAAAADCDDGDACNGAEQCAGGVCVAGPPTDCDDDDPCTDDACEPATGCVHSAAPGVPCDDENLCTLDDLCACTTATCEAAACVGGSPPDCNDFDPCTIDSCDPAEGCRNILHPDCL